jgi:hypothetical protein
MLLAHDGLKRLINNTFHLIHLNQNINHTEEWNTLLSNCNHKLQERIKELNLQYDKLCVFQEFHELIFLRFIKFNSAKDVVFYKFTKPLGGSELRCVGTINFSLNDIQYLLSRSVKLIL